MYTHILADKPVCLATIDKVHPKFYILHSHVKENFFQIVPKFSDCL